jgi:hypothetical protein
MSICANASKPTGCLKNKCFNGTSEETFKVFDKPTFPSEDFWR